MNSQELKTSRALIALTIVFTTLCQSKVLADTGGASGGGGVGMTCEQNDGTRKVYLADTYSMVSSGKIEALLKYQPMDLVQAAAGLLDILKPERKYDSPLRNGEKVTLGWMINYRHQQLKFVPNFSGKLKLPTLHDDHIDPNSLPQSCEKVQLAVQDIAAMTVQQSPLVYQLSWPERGFMELHETLISLRGLPGADTTPIRAEVSTLAEEIESANSPLRQQIAEALPSGVANLCYNQRTKIDILLGDVKDPGFWGGEDSIKSMCESMFSVGSEVFAVGLVASGGGYGESHVAEAQSCMDQIAADVTAKTNTIFAYKRRCQEVINKYSCVDNSGVNTSWGKEYSISTQIMGFGDIRCDLRFLEKMSH